MTDAHDNLDLTPWQQWLHGDGTPQQRSVATVTVYLHHLTDFTRWLNDMVGIALTPTTATPYRMAAYLMDLAHHRQRKPATMAQCRAALMQFGVWLVAVHGIPSNPAAALRVPPPEHGPPKTLSTTVLRRLLDAAHHTGMLRDAVIVELLAHSGMRASELVHVRVRDVERGRRTTWLHIHGKGQRMRRIPVPQHVSRLLEDYLAERRIHEGEVPPDSPILVGTRGALTRRTINRTVEQVAARAILSPEERTTVTPHAFRHTVATQLVRHHDVVLAADFLGHANINTTRHYAKASMDELEEAVETLYPPPKR